MCHVQLDPDIFENLTVQIRIALEKQWRGGNPSHKGEGEVLTEKGVVPLCNTVVLKLYTQVLQKILQDTCFPYISAVLPILYLLRLARAKVQVKVS